MEQSAVEWLHEQFTQTKRMDFENMLEQAKEIEKQQKGYSEAEAFKMINDFCFDWNYNYKGELSQKEYLIEWFKKLEKK